MAYFPLSRIYPVDLACFVSFVGRENIALTLNEILRMKNLHCVKFCPCHAENSIVEINLNTERTFLDRSRLVSGMMVGALNGKN